MATATSTGSWLDPPELHGKRNSDGTFTLEELELKRLNDYNRKVAKMIQGGLNLANLNAAANRVFTDIQGNVTEVTATAQGLESRVSSAEGNIVTAQQTASSASVAASNALGEAQSVALTVDGFTVTGAGGTTLINGDCIKSGTIEGVTLVSSRSGHNETVKIEDGEILLTSNGTSGGIIADVSSLKIWSGWPMNSPIVISNINGTVEINAGNIEQTAAGVIKLEAGTNMSIDSGGTIYIGTSSGYSGNVDIGKAGGFVNLIGNVSVNGVPIGG